MSRRRSKSSCCAYSGAAAAACCVLFLAAHARAQEPVAKQFLRHLYGAEGIDIARICHPSDDLWMLGGARDSEALDAIEGIRIDTARNGVVSGVVRSTMYFFELRDGLVDASYALDGVYLYHRRLVMEFLYACLAHEMESLERMTTDAGKVRILGPAPPSGEMAQEHHPDTRSRGAMSRAISLFCWISCATAFWLGTMKAVVPGGVARLLVRYQPDAVTRMSSAMIAIRSICRGS